MSALLLRRMGCGETSSFLNVSVRCMLVAMDTLSMSFSLHTMCRCMLLPVAGCLADATASSPTVTSSSNNSRSPSTCMPSAIL